MHIAELAGIGNLGNGQGAISQNQRGFIRTVGTWALTLRS